MPDRPARPKPETPHRDKLCKACRRPIPWTAAHATDWDLPQYCSESCCVKPTSEQIAALEAAILSLLAARGPTKTICPSEAAKLVAQAASGSTRPPPQAAWQPLMEPARRAARRLVAAGRIFITQHGETVDPAHTRGPIRLKLRQP